MTGPSEPHEYPPIEYPPGPGLPPPVYHQPQPWGYPMKPPGTNGMAIAALVISVVSLTLCAGVISIVSLILGFVAMRETKRTGQEGWGLALAGVIVSVIPLVLWALYLLFFVALFSSGWQWT